MDTKWSCRIFVVLFIPFRRCTVHHPKNCTPRPALKFTMQSSRQPGSVIQLGKTVDPASCVSPIHHTVPPPMPHFQTAGCALIYFRPCLLTLGENGNCGSLPVPQKQRTTHPSSHTHTVSRNLRAFLKDKHWYYVSYITWPNIIIESQIILCISIVLFAFPHYIGKGIYNVECVPALESSQMYDSSKRKTQSRTTYTRACTHTHPRGV